MAKSRKNIVLALYFVSSKIPMTMGPWTSPTPRNVLGYSCIVKPPPVAPKLRTLIANIALKLICPGGLVVATSLASQEDVNEVVEVQDLSTTKPEKKIKG